MLFYCALRINPPVVIYRKIRLLLAKIGKRYRSAFRDRVSLSPEGISKSREGRHDDEFAAREGELKKINKKERE